MANKIVKWQITVNHIVNNMIRSQSIIVDAPEDDLELAKQNALKIATEKGWESPRVTKAKRY